MPTVREVGERLLKMPERFGIEEVFERECLRIGWRWFIKSFEEGWDKARDLEATVKAIIKAAHDTNEGDGVMVGQEALDLKPKKRGRRPEPANICGEKITSPDGLRYLCGLDPDHEGAHKVHEVRK